MGNIDTKPIDDLLIELTEKPANEELITKYVNYLVSHATGLDGLNPNVINSLTLLTECVWSKLGDANFPYNKLEPGLSQIYSSRFLTKYLNDERLDYGKLSIGSIQYAKFCADRSDENSKYDSISLSSTDSDQSKTIYKLKLAAILNEIPELDRVQAVTDYLKNISPDLDFVDIINDMFSNTEKDETPSVPKIKVPSGIPGMQLEIVAPYSDETSNF